MAQPLWICHFLCTLLAQAVLQGIVALQFDVFTKAPSNPGGIGFDKEIGIPFAKQLMETTTKYVWNMFEQFRPANRKTDVEVVHMIIDTNVDAEAITDGAACPIMSARLIEGIAD
ncbi:uncharacterized protein LOC130778767 [Actinidia eriantha]|uniref:uncharacterized protein LOC130778767 n=1 Tax=Actinidia eriantha TaxID=165200 RepID=UPI00258F3768|nr:uncharacterized protein LOC130778767 [Actinidia eriantha]